MQKTSITVAEGDGIGPEIMAATLSILEAAGAKLDIKKVEIGEKVYLRGLPSGIESKTWETIRHSKAFLKAPITTPQGGGFKSLNVTVRTTMGLFANVRPCASYFPFVDTKHPKMDVVIIRENEEDLYTGIEYQQTPVVYQALKIMTRPGCEKIIRYAFEYAKAHNRKKVTCFTKDNILKLTDGLFHKIFDEIGAEYPEIEKEHWIIDIGTAKLADTPEMFDVIVLPNLYGDILSDVAAEIAGSVGLAGSANIGATGAMFEAIHGSAPKRAGQNVANPSGLLLAAIQMMVYIGQPEVATLIHNAWLKTIEDGIHTYDIFKKGVSKQNVGTKEFAQAVIERLGQKPKTLTSVHYNENKKIEVKKEKKSTVKNELVGADVFIHWSGTADQLAKKLEAMKTLKLQMIANRGVKVWPETHPETLCVDCWRCRFIGGDIVQLLSEIEKIGLEVVQVSYLFNFDGKPGYTLSQDQQ